MALSLIAWLHQSILSAGDLSLLLPAFGASAILLYGAPQSAMAQPWNIFVGGILSAVVGVAVAMLPLPTWLLEALAVAVAIMVMEWTGSMHPPAGAIAFLAANGNFATLGFGFVICPVATGLAVMFAVAVAAHRLQPGVQYPLPRVK